MEAWLKIFANCKHLKGLSFHRKSGRIGRIFVNPREPRSNALSLMCDKHSEGAMLEILLTTFVAAFVVVTLFGHVMVAKALMTPDHA